MRVLYIITEYPGGGAQKYVSTLSTHFNAPIASGGQSSIQLKHLKRDIRIISDILAIFEIRKLLKINSFDIVHLNSTKAGVLGSLATIGLSTKVIYTAHGFVFKEKIFFPKKIVYLFMEWLAARFRDITITVSSQDQKLASNYGLGKSVHIPNGIEPITFKEKRESLDFFNLDYKNINLVSVANYFPNKNLATLIKSIPLIKTKDKITLTLIGEGGERQKLTKLIESLNLTNKVKLFGKVSYPAEYLKAFNIFILPSFKEGFPYAVLEAMSAGLPLILSNIPSHHEIASNSAIYIDPKNHASLASQISNLISNSELQNLLSTNSLKQSKTFTESEMLSKTKGLYEQVLK